VFDRLCVVVVGLACLSTPTSLFAQVEGRAAGARISHGGVEVVTLADALQAADANNRVIHVAQLEREKAQGEVRVARTQRWPVFSVTGFGSQPLTQLGVTLERGSLGVYPNVGPIPGRTSTLESPLQIGFILYASVAQPLTQQHKIGLGIALAQVGVETANERLRAQRQSTFNEVRRLYYGIAQAESGRKTLQTAVDFLKQLDLETNRQVAQHVALQADSLNVRAQLAQAEYDLLKLDDPIQTQRQQLNRLMGRDVDAPFQIDPSSADSIGLMPLHEAYAQALASRPEIRLAKLQTRKAELDRRIKNDERIPDVSLSASVLKTANFSSVLPDNVTSVGVQATWDVFDWGRKRTQLDTKRDAEAQALLEQKDAEALVLIDVGHQYRRVIEARQELDLARALQASSMETLRVTHNRYTQREALLSDVIKVQSTVADADHRCMQALMNLATAQADLEKAMGKDQ
jgi:outer membrane protein TolC